jgi:hypothetical protein
MLVLGDVIFGTRRHFRELLQARRRESRPTSSAAGSSGSSRRAYLLTREEATHGQRASYSMTEAGIQTLPVMVAMGNSGLAHRHCTRRAAGACQPAPRRRSGLIERFMDELREAHLGIPLPDADRPRASEQLQTAYDAAMAGTLTSPAT